MNNPTAVVDRRAFPSWVVTTLLIVTSLLLLGVFSRLYFGSLSAALDYTAGRRLVVDNPHRSVGKISAGQQRDAAFAVTNFSNQPIVLLGASSGCTCTFAKSLPVTLPPHSQRQVLVTVRGDKVGPEANQVVFLTDSADYPSLAVSVVGQVDPR